MPVKTGRLAEFRRALERVDPSARHGFDPGEHLGSARSLPPDLADQLRKLDTDELMEILGAQDAQLDANRELHRFVSDLVRLRVGKDEVDEEEFAPPEKDSSPPEEGEEFFVGWMGGEGGRVEMVSQVYSPGNRAQISHETLQRYRGRVQAGGFVGKLGSSADLAEAIRLQRQNDRWSGRTLQRVGEVKADELIRALKAIITPVLKEILEREGNDVVTLALDGRRAVLLTRDGRITKLNRVETRHLALVGILPRHWFLPLMWWKRMLSEQDAQDAEQGRSKKRIYKGRYDDDEVEREEKEEEKER